MAHNCFECGGFCYCDGEDMEHEDAPDNCTHLCPPESADDDFPVDEEDAMRGCE